MAGVDVKRLARRTSRAVKRVAHVPREYVYRLPSPVESRRIRSAASPTALTLSEELKERGIVLLRDHVSGELLSTMQQQFDNMVDEIRNSPPGAELPIPEGHYEGTYCEEKEDAETQSVFTYEPFRKAPSLLQIALNPLILEMVSLYFGKKTMLHQVVAARYLPMPTKDFGSWQWHHDAWGKRINVMLLLTDVSAEDQYMSYMAGSHRLIHPLERYSNSRYTEDEVRSYANFERVDCIAPAGSVWVFDSNGFHRGNRSEGAHRDALISHYSSGRYIWKMEIPRESTSGLLPEQVAYLERNPRVQYL